MKMRKVFLEARLTYIVYVRSIAFRMILVIGILGILLLFNFNRLYSLFDDGSHVKIAVIMAPNEDKNIHISEFQGDKFELIKVQMDERDNIIESLDSPSANYQALIDLSDGFAPIFHYNEQMPTALLQEVLSISTKLSDIVKYNLLGMPPDMISKVVSSKLQIVGHNTVDNSIINLVANLLLFFTLFIYVVKIGDNIIEEKTARISETLLSYIEPSELLFGKLLGMFLSLITHLLAFIVTWTFSNAVFKQFPFIVRVTKAFQPQTLVIMIGMLFLGYLIYGLLYAANSSQARTVQDTGQAMIVQSILLVISFYIALMMQMHYDPVIMGYIKFVPIIPIFTNMVYVAVEQPGYMQVAMLIIVQLVYIVALTVPLTKRFRKGITNYA